MADTSSLNSLCVDKSWPDNNPFVLTSIVTAFRNVLSDQTVQNEIRLNKSEEWHKFIVTKYILSLLYMLSSHNPVRTYELFMFEDTVLSDYLDDLFPKETAKPLIRHAKFLQELGEHDEDVEIYSDSQFISAFITIVLAYYKYDDLEDFSVL